MRTTAAGWRRCRPYRQSREEAVAKMEALALRILAERLEHGEPTPELDGVFEAA